MVSISGNIENLIILLNGDEKLYIDPLTPNNIKKGDVIKIGQPDKYIIVSFMKRDIDEIGEYIILRRYYGNFLNL